MAAPNAVANGILERWLGLGAFYGALVLLLLIFRSRFDWERDLADIPALWLAAGMVIAGGAFLTTPRLVRDTLAIDHADQRRVLVHIVAIGLALRILLIWSTPALEDDFHRYLWDGAMTAHGFNPYRIVPATVPHDSTPQLIRDLAVNAGYVFDRINHATIRTIYPPVAQSFFALAYLAEPWSLLAWRLVCLAAEGATLGLLLILLREVGRSPLWVALYWLNPLIIKELLNSAHMEAIVVPFVLAALLLAIRNRPLAAAGVLVLAGGTKVWPLLLAPLILRPLIGDLRRLALATALLGFGTLLVAAPMIAAGLDQSAGVVAYGSTWQRNGALVPGLAALLDLFPGVDAVSAGMLARAAVVAAAGASALLLARHPIRDGTDLMARAALLVTAVLLLSPAQYPWYLAWVMPLMALRPIAGMLAATALMPIYYASFHFRVLGVEAVFNTYVVWLIWAPIWVLLWREARTSRSRYSSDRVEAERLG